eukprot:CAMPEP_0202456916 /NCGR_PEP_ID=MMETSP1360-20130828/14074_1 /ASSEMBLY_ACC=CAM_ASM_000848 /TAXON_ID=515479 /ORGANISM="Licmophora paradoxa, Strain CCMP2313" /LENGTH=114 /DNA_ID=CAMNT_0049076875 /DNA_START=56 /DNA_END=400 /DNA_ORIENTATION=-
MIPSSPSRRNNQTSSSNDNLIKIDRSQQGGDTVGCRCCHCVRGERRIFDWRDVPIIHQLNEDYYNVQAHFRAQAQAEGKDEPSDADIVTSIYCQHKHFEEGKFRQRMPEPDPMG